MEPVQIVLGVGVEVEREVPDVLAAVGEEDHGLVGLHALAAQYLEQASFRLGVDLLHEREALRGTVGGHALARDHFEPAVTAGGLRTGVDVAAVQADDQRQVRAGQLLPVPLAALGEHGPLGTEFTLQPPRHRGDLVADRAAVQDPPQGQNLTQQAPGQVERHHCGEPGLQIDQLRGTALGQNHGQRAEGGPLLGVIGLTRTRDEARAVQGQRPEQCPNGDRSGVLVTVGSPAPRTAAPLNHRRRDLRGDHRFLN